MVDDNFCVNLSFDKCHGFILQKVLDARHLYQDDDKQNKKQHTSDYPEYCLKGYAANSFQVL